MPKPNHTPAIDHTFAIGDRVEVLKRPGRPNTGVLGVIVGSELTTVSLRLDNGVDCVYFYDDVRRVPARTCVKHALAA